jgi:Leucine-rich repeat (LRR) protein
LENLPSLNFVGCAYNKLSGILSLSDLPSLKFLGCGYNELDSINLSNLKAFESLSARFNKLANLSMENCPLLKDIDCESNNLTSLDLSNKIRLEIIRCKSNKLNNLNLDNCPQLKQINCELNNLLSLNLSNRIALKSISCQNNKLSNFSLENCPSLIELNLENNNINILSLKNLTSLKELAFSGQELNSIILSKVALEQLNFSGFKKLSKLSLSDLLDLKDLNCTSTLLDSLSLTELPLLRKVVCSFNKLTTLNLSNLPNLQVLDIRANMLTSLSLEKLPFLKSINCSDNKLTNLNLLDLQYLEYLDFPRNLVSDLSLVNLPLLHAIDCSNNKLINLSLSNLPSLVFINLLNNNIKNLTLKNLISFSNLYLNSQELNTLVLSNLPKFSYLDAKEYKQLTTLNLSNLPNFNNLNCSSTLLDSLSLTELPLLRIIVCSFNKLTTLNLSNLPNLQVLDIRSNNLTTLSLEKVPLLKSINCNDNKLTNLSLANLSNLEVLDSKNNLISNLSLVDLPLLNSIDCSENKLNNLNISSLPSLKNLDCSNNLIKNLDLIELPILFSLDCSKNELTKLSLSQLPTLSKLICIVNPLMSLLIKQENNKINLEYFNAPVTLNYICTDVYKIPYFDKVKPNTNTVVNSYCPSTNVNYNTLLGETKIDLNNDGCDTNDIKLPYLKYRIANGLILETIIANEFGEYSIPLVKGDYKIKPIPENEEYYNITPTSAGVSFLGKSVTISKNFCITSIKKYRQIDITIIPLSPPARPGFNAQYKAVITNKGNQRENGTLNFRYNEALLDYINADTIPKTKGNGLVSWDFKDLLPFETRTYTVTIKVNKPTDTPAVNAGDTLNFTASILDNVFTLNNRVVGAYDPNDKTCLEGEKITPNLIDKFVHYLIRFENTGTYAAENVVVKDSIDTSVFDINSLQITDASHRSFTRINGNVVEFIFEDIQLPFDDANNDGYIAFKIKTKPTLKVGNILKNKANIYFDYNFPIITNEAKTVIASTVNTQNIQAEADIAIYPNPASDFFRIDSDVKVSKVDIHDLSGRLLQSSISVENQVDIKGLNEGTYIVKIYSDKGIRVGKMIKGKN